MDFLSRIKNKFSNQTPDQNTHNDNRMDKILPLLDPEDQVDYYHPEKRSDISSLNNTTNGNTFKLSIKREDLQALGAPDEYLKDAGILIIEKEKASIGMIQRAYKLGFSRAAYIIDQLSVLGVVSGELGTKPRKILMSKEEFLALIQYVEEERACLELQKFESSYPHTDLKDALDIAAADNMSGLEFEQWCADLLRKNDFIKVKVTSASNDQGVDILAEKGGVKYAFQCKCYASDLGNTPVQEVNAGRKFYNCHVGVVMTNSHFTNGARALAEKTGTLLWDRETLNAMLR